MFQANLTTCVYKEPWAQWWETLSKNIQRILNAYNIMCHYDQ